MPLRHRERERGADARGVDSELVGGEQVRGIHGVAIERNELPFAVLLDQLIPLPRVLAAEATANRVADRAVAHVGQLAGEDGHDRRQTDLVAARDVVRVGPVESQRVQVGHDAEQPARAAVATEALELEPDIACRQVLPAHAVEAVVRAVGRVGARAKGHRGDRVVVVRAGRAAGEVPQGQRVVAIVAEEREPAHAEQAGAADR